MYLDIHFAVPATSQSDVGGSTVFFFQWMMLAELLSKPRAMCFLDHLVTVTRSSTWTSLTSNFEKWLCNSPMVCDECGGDDGCDQPLEEEWLLLSGLICVAMSFLIMTDEAVVPPSFELSCLPSTLNQWVQNIFSAKLS